MAEWGPGKVHRPDDVDIDLHDVDDEDVGAVGGDRQAPHCDHVAVRLLSFSNVNKIKISIDKNAFWNIWNKLTSLVATLVRNYDPACDSLTRVKV